MPFFRDMSCPGFRLHPPDVAFVDLDLPFFCKFDTWQIIADIIFDQVLFLHHLYYNTLARRVF